MKKLLLILIALGLTAIAVMALRVSSGNPVPQATDYIQGIDISHHNGAIDWRAVGAGDIRFVYMKASEGEGFVDPKFKLNWERAGQTDLYRGAYHFFTQCRTAEQQAANFIRVAGDMNGALPPALDLEHMGPCREGPTTARIDLEVKKMMDILESHYGVRPVLYTTQEFHDRYLIDFEDEKFWVRSIFQAPTFREGDWLIWQHHHRGAVQGIKGATDLNAFRGSVDDLEALRMRGHVGG